MGGVPASRTKAFAEGGLGERAAFIQRQYAGASRMQIFARLARPWPAPRIARTVEIWKACVMSEEERRQRSRTLAAAGVVAVVLVLGIWLGNVLMEARKADDCLSSSRTSCRRLDVK
jgi:hypothetical protein